MAATGRIYKTILFTFLFQIFLTCSHSETDTLQGGEQRSDWEVLLSANGRFKLGFFSPGKSKSRYLGITLVSGLLKVDGFNLVQALWVANRNNPIPDTSGNLMLTKNGELKISYGGGQSLVLSSETATGNTTATLLDSGNFILKELNSDGSIKRILWQSFDYPSDTLLPGMKLGSEAGGHKWSLTSWLSDDVPAEGPFTLSKESYINGTVQLIIRQRENVYWSSGIWPNGSFFSEVHASYDEFKITYVSHESEKYFAYTSNVGSQLRLGSGGEITIALSAGLSAVYSPLSFKCPGKGCVEAKLPECRNGNYSFAQGSYSVSNFGFKYYPSYNITLSDCRDKCLQNCSCVAYASYTSDGLGCSLWNNLSELVKYEDPDATTVFVLALTSPPDISSFLRKHWWMWLVIGLGGVTPGVALVCYMRWRNLKRAGANKLRRDILLGLEDYKYGEKKLELQFFSFPSIVAATANFSTANKLGEGGFGPVYKGKLLDDQEIAIKRLSRASGQGVTEFKNEVILIAKLQHTNLVRLLGCCIEGEEKILIYEFMPNKSLDFFLFDHERKKLLDWKKRLNIIEGICQGLIYLHKYSRLRVIHRDLKASNILLGNEMNPKISDFGMAKLFGQNQSEANTNRIVGTYGYMSPEYAMEGICSIKSDVFSFGVLLLEIMSGRRNNSFCHSEFAFNLIGHAWELWNEGRGLTLLDAALIEQCPEKEALRFIHVGLLCVQENASDRPTMSDVISMFNNETISLSTPKKPAFSIGRRDMDAEIPKLDICSVYTVSMSEVEGR